MSDRRQQWKIALSLAALVAVSAGTGAVLTDSSGDLQSLELELVQAHDSPYL